jgi:hypothetical protein
VADAAALDVTTMTAGGGRDMWVGASGAEVEVAADDEVTIKEAEIRVDWDCVNACSSMLARETKQACMTLTLQAEQCSVDKSPPVTFNF